ncbi:hypothetical protein BT69DRAFT_1357475, partial [Atractiella rhizophila]
MPFVYHPTPSPGLSYFSALPPPSPPVLPHVISNLRIPKATQALLPTPCTSSSSTHPTRVYYHESDEELVWHRSTVVHSRKSTIYRIYDLASYKEKVSSATFGMFEISSSKTFLYETSTTFLGSRFTLETALNAHSKEEEENPIFGPWLSPPEPKPSFEPVPQRGLLIILERLMLVYFPDGRDFLLRVPFPVAAVATLRVGVLLEAATTKRSTSIFEQDEEEAGDVPRLYSTTTPLQELRPVGGIEVDDRLVWAEDGWLVSTKEREGKITIWEVREAEVVEDDDEGDGKENEMILEELDNPQSKMLDIEQHFLSSRQHGRYQFLLSPMFNIATDIPYIAKEIKVTRGNDVLIITTPRSTHSLTFAPSTSPSLNEISITESTTFGEPSVHATVRTPYGASVLRSNPDRGTVTVLDQGVEVRGSIEGVRFVDNLARDGWKGLRRVLESVKDLFGVERWSRVEEGGWDALHDVLIGLSGPGNSKKGAAEVWERFLAMERGELLEEEEDEEMMRSREGEKEWLEALMMPLHVVFQEFLLFESQHADARRLGNVMVDLSRKVGWVDWWDYYIRFGGKESYTGTWGESITHPPPPDFLDSFRVGLRNPSDISPELFSWVPRPSRLYDIASVALASPDGSQGADKYARISALLLDANFWTAEMVDDLSLGFRAVVSEVVAVIRRFPMPNLDKSLSELIGREDMRMMAPDTNKRLDYKDMCEWKKWSPWRNLEKPITFPTINPVPHFWKKPSSPPSQPVHTENIRFSKDRRLEDVARILQYIEPVTLSVPSLQQDHNIPSRTNTYMGHLALRTLSLQLGFAMYTFRSRMAPEEGMVDKFALKTPICLFARLLPGKSLTKYEDPSLKKEWPTFHHGVASAL